MNFRNLSTLFIAITVLGMNSAIAAKSGGGRSSGGSRSVDMRSSFTVGGSIAAPSTYLGVFTNPAVLSQTSGVRLGIQAGANNVWDQPTYRGGLQAGLGFVGLAAYADRHLQNGADQSNAYAGLGLEIPFLNLALGAAMKKGINGPSTYQDWKTGLLFQVGFLQLGLTALSTNENFSEVGAGLGVVLIDGVDVVVDSAASNEMKNPQVKPGLKLYNPFGGFSVSYGSGDRNQFSKGVTLASFVRLGLNSEIEVAYNHGGELPKYYAALSMGF